MNKDKEHSELPNSEGDRTEYINRTVHRNGRTDTRRDTPRHQWEGPEPRTFQPE